MNSSNRQEVKELSHEASYAKREGGRLLIGNGAVESVFELSPEPRLTRVLNKIDGSGLAIEEKEACALRLGTGVWNITIPEWRFHAGSGEGTVSRRAELGYSRRFFAPETDTDEWSGAQRLTDFPIGGVGYSAVVYPGYGWYRNVFELPADIAGQPVELTLGGCDRHDWHSRWVYINGEPVGEAHATGAWRVAPTFRIGPADPAYAALNFGGVNTLAVQTKGLDRRTPDMVESDAERYSIGSFLVDQRVSAGPALREVASFALIAARETTEPGRAALELEYANEAEGLRVSVKYWVDDNDPALYRQASVTNDGGADLELMELDLWRFAAEGGSVNPTSGGLGMPSRIGADWFCGVRHPAGVCRADAGEFRLYTLPGARLRVGESYVGKVGVLGTATDRSHPNAFVEYIARHGRRKREWLNMYHNYGIHDLAGLAEPTSMTYRTIMDNLDDLERLQAKGVRFDYYYIDAGWSDPHDLKAFDPANFPQGSDAIFARIRSLGMKAGLWTSPASGASAFHVNFDDPLFATCSVQHREAHEAKHPVLCLACEEWRGKYEEALLHHVRVNKVEGFKTDGNAFFCTNPHHTHASGKYSLEPIADALIRVLDNIRAECPDLMVMYYWSIQSPWWLLHGDTLYERGVLMEGSTPSDIPTRKLRQSVSISFDQALKHAMGYVPPHSGDSLGVWISKWRWASYMGKEDWQDAWTMELGRGSLMAQLWGDLSMFDGADDDFLARAFAWTDRYGRLLQLPQKTFGDPWTAKPYGYAYFRGGEGVLFAFNPQFEAAEVALTLDESLGFRSGEGGAAFGFVNAFPESARQAAPSGTYRCGDTLRWRLEPFEAAVLQLAPAERLAGFKDQARTEGEQTASSGAAASSADSGEAAPAGGRSERSRPLQSVFAETRREAIAWNDPERQGVLRRLINGRAQYIDTESAFRRAEAVSDGRDREVERRAYTLREKLPPEQGDPATLLVHASFAREGVYWHHHSLHDIIRVEGAVGGTALAFRSTPYRWHEEAGGWSWILFEAKLPAEAHGGELALEVELFAPRTVDVRLEGLLFRD